MPLNISSRLSLSVQTCWIVIILLTGYQQSVAKTLGTIKPTQNAAIHTLDIQERLATLAHLDYREPDFLSRIADGRLASLYVQLQNQLQWTRSLQTLLVNNTTAVSASQNLQKLITSIQAFYAHYTAQSLLGDSAAYTNPDVIVILGANRQTLQQRLMFALPIIRRFPSAPIVLSGGGRTVELEAGVMHDFLISHGIQATRLILETDSLDTVGNAVFTSFALREQSITGKKILLITSNFHGPRSLFLFQKILGARFQLAAALAPSEETNLSKRIDNELQQQATSIDELLRWGPIPGHEHSDEQVKNGCDVFFQMLLRHDFYTSRWDLARHYADICRN